MKREMFKLKMSAEKSQRSKLKFSEELSESKRSYRRLKKKD